MVVSSASHPTPLLCYISKGINVSRLDGNGCRSSRSQDLEDQVRKLGKKNGQIPSALLQPLRGGHGGAGGPVYWQGPDLPPPRL